MSRHVLLVRGDGSPLVWFTINQHPQEDLSNDSIGRLERLGGYLD